VTIAYFGRAGGPEARSSPSSHKYIVIARASEPRGATEQSSGHFQAVGIALAASNSPFTADSLVRPVPGSRLSFKGCMALEL
jgi:hypothetical protein